MTYNGSQWALSLTFDVEMVTNFPYWSSVWDHRKGALDAESKAYVLRLNDLARAYHVPFQYFVLGSTLEEPDLDYLKRVADDGHPIGNHTYHHVNVKAETIDQLQVTYRTNPWWAGARSPLQCIADEVGETTLAMRARLGIAPSGFRTPGGFGTGLRDAPSVQDLLRDQGFAFASSHYDYPVEQRRGLDQSALDLASRTSLDRLQPYRYPSGLPEVPMMGLSDVWAFRILDLDRREYLRVLLATLDYAYDRRHAVSLLFHPAVLAARDPHCEVVETLLRHALAKPGGCWVTDNASLVQEVLT
jgi:peptidoglycan/xylan/chitin deacetylase (PgdA/CDA1 family)